MVETQGGEPGDGAAEVLDRPLPDGVRRRVVHIVSEGFGGLTVGELPAQLRQYARFAPNRRAKFAGNAMAAALETDPLFRQRIGEKFREAQPELCGALDSGAPPPAADPLDVAAAAYVLRPTGWVKLVTAAGEEAQRADAERADEESRAELERLREELTAAREQTRTETERLRTELESAKKEAESLHRKLRAALSDVKRGEAALRKLQGEMEAVRAEGQAQVSAAESESRRLKARLGEAEAALEATRRAAREGRSVEDMRVRLLLDTVLDAAQGLRRELALPPVSVRPAETVDAVEPGRMTPKDIAARALSENDPAILDQLLALPQAHLVVDGYNVTKTGYPQMPLEKQRLRLLGQLSQLAAQTGAEVTCVFDGAELAAPVLLAPPRGVRVLFSKAGVTADELIRQLVRAEPPGRPVIVASTDREVADGVAKAGARPVASAVLLKRLS
ncbi:putative RNA-binding protein with PIN domain/outer membrane murein-binding lipoprotein Lpp [Streptomyces sp. SAI-208]|uniref:NYN domain-containing protein n=1 Tax=unclassified Streptomyces TaxID=2593676 RepID=UPI002474D71B|nr:MULTISPECIES: NYN domain-containing protein [unclassified Streptomyces]MDH6551838.1 putative RNA-binding protein with PIN domain/outer membrane murein-binding lipoprotein Lpp [Streptomyces sp. SAI-041]MDH6570928.1 putative RNA-binding protein with PIN domain/outer membrane murein-binding lipoprotein Lpp [Streptomyces sp. SAI-117]MDH6584104.1 putative RNA-binding protein with PIN domain/outer membrane murein-binding lipoprotein Lpp [Streptomyces sp. SAI-133]MDH6610604.1 putative RNA-binding p